MSYLCPQNCPNMKKILAAALCLGLLIACETESKLTYEPLKLEGEACEKCPKIDINIPNALDDTPVAKAINRALGEEIISILSFSDGAEIDNVEKAIASFTDSYRELRDKYDYEMPWEATVDGRVVHENDELVCLEVKSYSFTGGAHGYSSTTYLNFDKGKSRELEAGELFRDLKGFEDFAEARFRQRENIPAEGNINATGFMFEGDRFHLPLNIGYTDQGLQLIYNQYEVASYADGPIVLTLPYSEVNPYLKFKVKS